MAKTFFQKNVSPTLDSDVDIQRCLMGLAADDAETPEKQIAILCLRCFISHQIEQNCRQLESQFGKSYGFTRYDLFAFVFQLVNQRHLSLRERISISPWLARFCDRSIQIAADSRPG